MRGRQIREEKQQCRTDPNPTTCRALVRARRAASIADCNRRRTTCVQCCQQAGSADTCRQSALVGACATNADCDDSNVCTDDLCDPNMGCLHSDVSVTCNDGNACTSNDTCNGGVCVGGDTSSGCTACQAVATISADGGTFIGDTSGAGTLTGSCGTGAPSGERVYAWTPSSSGQATIQTCGAATTFDTVLYVRQGSCTGSETTCNDDTQGCTTGLPNDTGHGSRVTPTVTAGQTYYIVVDGFGGSTGTFSLTVFPPSVCGNGVREGAEECDGADHGACASQSCTAQCTCVPPAGGEPDLIGSISDVQVAFNSTVDPGDVAEGCATGLTADLLRFSQTTKNIGTADFFLGDPMCPSCTLNPGVTCGNPLFICSPAGGHHHAHYQNYARYELLSAGQVVATGHKQGFCLEDASCPNQKYTCTFQGLTPGCSDEYGSQLGCQYIDITGLAPGAYTLRTTVDPFNRIAELNEDNNAAEVPVTIPPKGVPSGACLSATQIPPQGGVFTGTTSGGSTEAGTCGPTGNAPERAFLWTPNTSGTATLETCGAQTTFDTVLYVRQGACNDQQTACNDDTTGCEVNDANAGPGSGSRVSLSVTAGQTYWIFVDGYANGSGSFALTVTPPGATTTTTITSGTSTSSTTDPAPTTTSTSTVVPTTRPTTTTHVVTTTTHATTSTTHPTTSTTHATTSTTHSTTSTSHSTTSTSHSTTSTSHSTTSTSHSTTSTSHSTTSTSHSTTSTSTTSSSSSSVSTSSTTTSRPPPPPTSTTVPDHPPLCRNARADAGKLWPPDHKMVDVKIKGVEDPDERDMVSLVITGIRQDEAPDAVGSGNTCPDATGVGTKKAQVRAERSGLGDGRVYHIAFRASDQHGRACTGAVTVCVPHNGGPKGQCIDEGPLFNSTGPCVRKRHRHKKHRPAPRPGVAATSSD